jgi:hypothetical protein
MSCVGGWRILWRIVIRVLRKGLKIGAGKLLKFVIPDGDRCVRMRIVVSSLLAEFSGGSWLWGLLVGAIGGAWVPGNFTVRALTSKHEALQDSAVF